MSASTLYLSAAKKRACNSSHGSFFGGSAASGVQELEQLAEHSAFDVFDVHRPRLTFVTPYVQETEHNITDDETGHLLDAPCLLGHLVQGRPPARVSPHLPSFSQSFAEESSEGDHSTLKWRANGRRKEQAAKMGESPVRPKHDNWTHFFLQRRTKHWKKVCRCQGKIVDFRT